MARIIEERGETSRTLESAMIAPSQAPGVVVVDSVDEEVRVRDLVDPKKDLWLSTVDGRYSSPIIPIRVGPNGETFRVHKAVLTKSEYFSKALNGEFLEAEAQSIDLPEEDPDIFSFLVAYLYEEKFVPIKVMASVLVAEPDKGKRREKNENENSGSENVDESDGNGSGDEGARIRRRREQHRRRNEQAFQQIHRKDGNHHRPDCQCPTCTLEIVGPPCWSCGASRAPPIIRAAPFNGIHPAHVPIIIAPNGHPYQHPGPPRPPVPRPGPPRDRDRRRGPRNNVVVEAPVEETRMTPEDLRTWSLAYDVSIEVYCCAERYLMKDFKSCIAAFVVNSFEVAGLEAAVPTVLQSCKVLCHGVSPMDPLLKKIFARVGFLQARLWKNFPEETQSFFTENPELGLAIMKEMVERREQDKSNNLPSMERSPPITLPPRPADFRMPGGVWIQADGIVDD